MSLKMKSFLCFCSLSFFKILMPFYSMNLFSYPKMDPMLSLTHNFYTKNTQIMMAILLSSVIMIY